MFSVRGRPVSPLYFKEVYILGIISSPGNIEMAGTAFSITRRHVITAHHNIFDEEKQSDFDSFAITREVKKVASDFVFESPLFMKLVSKDPSADWAILELMPQHPNFLSCFPLCSRDQLPDPDRSSSQSKAIFAPIGSFRQSSLRSMHVWAEEFSKIFQYDENNVIVDGGLYRGSCGAPYITPEGLVIGMHLASMHEAKNMSLTKKKRNRASMEDGKGIVDVAESLTDLAEVHASTKVGLVLCMITEITEFIRKYNLP
jgi:hypothetical protein